MGKISTEKELMGPMVIPIIGSDDKSAANAIGSVIKFMRIQNTPIRQNTITIKAFLPIIFTVELPTMPIVAHTELAIAFIMNVFVSNTSLHSCTSCTVCNKKKIIT